MPLTDETCSVEFDPMTDVYSADQSTFDVVAEHGPFQLMPTCAIVTGTPTFAEWEAACVWVQKVEKASPFWVGDLLAYGDIFGHEAAQVLEATEYAEKTCSNAKYTCVAIPPARRHPNVPYAHHHEIAPLPPAEQDVWLQKCEDEHLTREQLRIQLKAHKATIAGAEVELWVLVRCADIEDQTDLADRMKKEGRSVMLKAKEL